MKAKNILALVILCIGSLSAVARTLTFSGEYGCALIYSQGKRIAAMDTIQKSMALKQDGLETTASKTRYDNAVAELIDISNKDFKSWMKKKHV